MYVIWFKTIQCMYEEEKRIENWVGVDETRLEWVDHCSSWLVGPWEFIILSSLLLNVFENFCDKMWKTKRSKGNFQEASSKFK